MPQLPSGLHFALVPGLIDYYMDQAHKGLDDKGLLKAQSVLDLFEFVRVDYFRKRTPDDEPSDAIAVEGGAPLPEDLLPYYSGFTLLSIRQEFLKWSDADRKEFWEFVTTKAVPLLEQKLAQIRVMRHRTSLN